MTKFSHGSYGDYSYGGYGRYGDTEGPCGTCGQPVIFAEPHNLIQWTIDGRLLRQQVWHLECSPDLQTYDLHSPVDSAGDNRDHL